MSTQNPRLNSNLKFILGIFIMLCGWIICFDVFLLIIGIPFFLIGMLLVFLSKKSIAVKIITVAIPIVLWWIGFEIILHEINKKTPVTLLIPENFKGQVRVVYGEMNGVVPQKENGRMLLAIPENGILIVQPFLESGLDDIEYYAVDSKNQRTRISPMKSSGEKFSSAIFQGTFSSVAPPGKPSDASPALDYIYDSFYIFPSVVPDQGNGIAIDPASYTEEAKNNPLTDSLVKVIRKIKD